LLDSLIGVAASNHWSRGINNGHFLTATAAITAGVSRSPGAGCIKGASTMTSGVGDGADNRNRIAATVIGGSRGIEAPGGALLDSFVGAAASNHWSGGINNGDFLTASAAVAAGIGGSPGAGRIESSSTMTSDIGDRAHN